MEKKENDKNCLTILSFTSGREFSSHPKADFKISVVFSISRWDRHVQGGMAMAILFNSQSDWIL